MRETQAYLGELESRGYTVVRSRHCKIYSGGRLVTVASSTPSGGKRGLDNLKAVIRRWERHEVHEEQQGVPPGTGNAGGDIDQLPPRRSPGNGSPAQ